MSEPPMAAETIAREDGAVLVMVAVWLPLLIIMASFVLDVGNWFEHKRHLQLQADAAALAAAGEFEAPCDDAVNAAVKDTAASYGGRDHNKMVGGTPPEKVLMNVNRKTWPEQSSPTDDITEGEPCTTGMVDVKMTEKDLPWFIDLTQWFGGDALVDFINAHARVELRRRGSGPETLPVGVPDNNPKRAKAIFVDETNGSTIATTDLVRSHNGSGLTWWSNSDGLNGSPGPKHVRIPSRHVGVRILLSGSDDPDPACGEPLVACYDATNTNGLSHIRGWSDATAGTAHAPVAKNVWLRPATCPDGYFHWGDDNCRVRAVAEVDFGVTGSTLEGLQPSVWATVGNKRYSLTRNTTTGQWESSESNTATQIPVPKGQSVDVGLEWEIKKNLDGTTCKTNCSGSLGRVQRSVSSSNARSGPVQRVEVWHGTTSGANSFRRCRTGEEGDPTATDTCKPSLVVNLAILSSLQDFDASQPPQKVSLRVTGSGSQNQSLDCHPTHTKLKDELAYGCSPHFQRNTGQSCPANTQALWSSTKPYTCVGVQTGENVNAIPAGMNLRIHGSEKPATCVNPDHSSTYLTGDNRITSDEVADDPRRLQVFLTPFGAFDGSGDSTVPITEFADFYVTDWSGQGSGFENPCPGNSAETGFIRGYFIKYFDRRNDGDATDDMCDTSALGTCAAVLTR